MANEQFIYSSEYIFSAADLKRLLDGATDPATTDVAIQVLISRSETEKKVFNIVVQAVLADQEGTPQLQVMTDRVYGCPRPPSC
ncbi:hypothetical protein [Adhaeribacter pallidiroseus]|uniref:Uncharacterized protein n=1 Tax=Adhaeribacter pallidiroseus TaxID=2072847 RepID=A0A369QD79_9BACT|nr:hypothetical protein [Adhaeribacter pallidiroseus]RDC62873.1 hypothetical protein AHMF7616_01472 [Adhaeribacter pallidiroseus]